MKHYFALTLLDKARQVSGDSPANADNLLKAIANGFVYVIGIVAVITLIVGGLRYTFSGGNPQAAAGARNTIVYALIGIAVAVAAYAMVNFVLDQVF